MYYRKLISALIGVAACNALAVTDASAQTSRREGHRHGGGAISQAAPCVATPRTSGPRTREFYPERTHTRRTAPRIVNDYPYPSYYDPYHYAYRYNTYYIPDTTAATTTSTTIRRQVVDTNVPYGWIHASVPYGHGAAV